MAVTIDPITPALGAEVRLDLSDLNADSVSLIYDALMTYQVLFFRDQTMTPSNRSRWASSSGKSISPPGISEPSGHTGDHRSRK